MSAVELVCLHHAGGSSASFHPMRRALDALGADVTVTAVNLPGRESRRNEPRYVDAATCVRALGDELHDLLDRPHILLGNSMGALLAYALAQQRISAGLRSPDALVVAACRPPHQRSALDDLELVDDAALAAAIVRYGGLPEEVLDHPEWLPLFIPTVRDDLRICRSYRLADDPPLPCPVHVLGGRDDALTPPDTLADWSRYSLRPQPVRLFATGHFLFRAPDQQVVGCLADIVAVGRDRSGVR